MANKDGREALRGAEEETFDLLAEVLSSAQWAELLRRPLEHAAHQGNRSLVQKLLGAGAHFGDGLHDAIWGGHEEIVKDLLESRAPVSAKETSRHDGFTPLHVAAFNGTTEMVQLLLLSGADKDALNNHEYTPLYTAVAHHHPAAALALIAAGADVNLRCGEQKQSVVHVAAREELDIQILKAAIEHGADVNAADGFQITPLHYAARHNRVEAIDVLVEAGANIEAWDSSATTPLQYATYGLHLEALLVLLKHDAGVNTQNVNLLAPLHSATCAAGQEGVAEVVDLLLRSGADETLLDYKGQAAADVVGKWVEDMNRFAEQWPEDAVREEDVLTEDIERVRELLTNAPADRAWRRRGYLVLCRAYPDRMHQIQESSSSSAGVAGSISSRTAEKASTEGAGGRIDPVGSSASNGDTNGDWAGLVARALWLQEQDIFRNIMGYL